MADLSSRQPSGFPDLMIRADSPDLKHPGRLKHIAKKGNVVVVP